MERFLETYIGRMKGQYPGFPEETAHEIASAFIAFKFGLYEKAASECANAIAMIPESTPANAALKKALDIIRTHATDLTNSRVTTDVTVAFSEAERTFVAIVIPPDKNEDPATLGLDNALVLVYVVALITSPDDEEALLEHRRTIVRILTDYKRAMGME